MVQTILNYANLMLPCFHQLRYETENLHTVKFYLNGSINDITTQRFRATGTIKKLGW
jgi:hypothetical protein